jgi:programmed cell death 6-interacting protein
VASGGPAEHHSEDKADQ